MRVTNYKRNAQVVNKPGGLTTDDQLTRRFYVLDAVSGVSAGGGGASSGKLPEAVRYLRSAAAPLMSTNEPRIASLIACR